MTVPGVSAGSTPSAGPAPAPPPSTSVSGPPSGGHLAPARLTVGEDWSLKHATVAGKAAERVLLKWAHAAIEHQDLIPPAVKSDVLDLANKILDESRPFSVSDAQKFIRDRPWCNGFLSKSISALVAASDSLDETTKKLEVIKADEAGLALEGKRHEDARKEAVDFDRTNKVGDRDEELYREKANWYADEQSQSLSTEDFEREREIRFGKEERELDKLKSQSSEKWHVAESLDSQVEFDRTRLAYDKAQLPDGKLAADEASVRAAFVGAPLQHPVPVAPQRK